MIHKYSSTVYMDVSVAQLVASMSGVVQGGVVMVVGSKLARGKIFTASIGSVDSQYIPLYIFMVLFSCKCLIMLLFSYSICTANIYIYIYIYIYTEGYSESTEPSDAVNFLPLARFEPTTSTTPPSTTPDIDATNCATETSPKKDVQEALILTTPDAVHVVYWFLFNAWHLFRSQVKAWWIQGYKWN